MLSNMTNFPPRISPESFSKYDIDQKMGPSREAIREMMDEGLMTEGRREAMVPFRSILTMAL
jgi:hypothetical protein